MPLYQEIDAATLQSLREEHEDLLLVDVRTPQEAAGGVIPGAYLLPLQQLPEKAERLLGHGRLVFYCQAGGRSAQACDYLLSRGVPNVANLRGGIMAWVRQDLPLVDPADTPGDHELPTAR